MTDSVVLLTKGPLAAPVDWLACQEGEMPHELNCPHCGCPLLTTPGTVRVPDADAVEVLHREIEHLRVTVARLRGAGFNPLRSHAKPATS